LLRGVLVLVLFAPVVSLPLAVLLDRGPSGETRTALHFFPLALWLFDDFAWTCTRNSVIFAIFLSLASLGLGGALGWLIVRGGAWGRAILGGLVVAMLAVSPAFLALGLTGLMGSPRPWPWPFSAAAGGTERLSLESWRGLSLWLVWIWTTLPGAVALVTIATASAVERLEPSWEDAARLSGAGPLRSWKALFWPLVRPRSVRAAAVVFLFALVEPGAPLVLGLRRTLAFQIVLAAGRPDAFPPAAVWAVMAGLFGLVGWILWRWAGGGPILEVQRYTTGSSRRARSPRPATPLGSLASTVWLAGWAMIGWLPLLGLLQLTLSTSGVEPAWAAGALRAVLELPRRFGDPPVGRLLANSLVLGLEVACGIMAIAWLVGPGSRARSSPTLRANLGRPIALVPPLVQGIGVLGLPWLAGLAAASLVGLDRWRPLAMVLGAISAGLEPVRDPSIMLPCGVGLALLPRFLWARQGEAQTGPGVVGSVSARDAALLCGASRLHAGGISQPLPSGRWLGRFSLAWALAATNLTPALLFEPGTEAQTIGPAVLSLAAGPADARSHAAALALVAIAVNLTALAVARVTSALPCHAHLE